VKLGGGTYEVACKPGQTGDGIRTKITVSGTKESAEATYDREVELAIGAGGLTGLGAASAKAGEKIEFKLENKTDGKRDLYLVDPAGKEVSEVEVAEGKTGEIIVKLDKPGRWTVKVEGGTADVEKPLTVR
jgi:uncharacterized cupredoxin-like copper-binding protein